MLIAIIDRNITGLLRAKTINIPLMVSIIRRGIKMSKNLFSSFFFIIKEIRPIVPKEANNKLKGEEVITYCIADARTVSPINIEGIFSELISMIIK
ncbi:hypothetical protein [Sulfurisphaera tokodaii]|uniref:Uncharacterized protein n=1 Tax=Sulfurisphaera tokodaii TaxID=111955 RepID=A0A832TCH4_9CREN|nr:hypothetical protein [Sulfurisphaera tokodaii]HII73404.1 hypothetical protein [Sulfurisphaera tokodaii]